MELSFVIAALKRKGWVVLLCGVVGFLAAVSIEPPRTQYESTGLLLLSPSGFDDGVAYANQPDRFVLSQLGVLEAEGLAERVAQRVTAEGAFEESAASVRASIEMTQDLDSDIVNITATTSSPERSTAIAQAYVDLYITEARATVEDTRRPELERLTAGIEAVEVELNTVNLRIQDVMKPYLPKSTDQTAQPIPDISIIDPDASAQRTNLRNELNSLIQQRVTLEADMLSSFSSVVVQNATQPDAPIGNSTTLLTAAVVFVGLTMGLVVALVWTRFSTRVLDEFQAAEILGTPIVGEVDHARALRRSPLVAFDSLPSSLIPIIDQLSVRAEALGSVNEPLTVAVVGTQRVAGTSTIATAMAGRFSAAEFEVVLVDLDASSPFLSEAFDSGRGEGLAAVFGDNPERAFSPTGRVGVTFLGRGHKAASIRRDLVSNVLEVAKSRANIVIVDAGSVLDAAATVELCDLADAVVVAVPIGKQEVRPLGHVARQFEPITKKVLPVVTHPTAKRAASARDEGTTSPIAPGANRVQNPGQPTSPQTPTSAAPVAPAARVPQPTPVQTPPNAAAPTPARTTRPASGAKSAAAAAPAGAAPTQTNRTAQPKRTSQQRSS